MRFIRHTLAGLSFVAFACLALWLVLATPLKAQDDQSALAGLLSGLLSTPTTTVSIGSVEGALSSNAVIRDIVIRDADGPWLRLDRAEIVWSRTALLLNRRLEVESLRVGTLEILRRPGTTPADEAAAESGPIIPELPVEVQIDEFQLEELFLGEGILGTQARLSAQGSASLGDPSQGLALTFSAERLDAPGTFSVELDYVPETNILDVDLVHDEPEGGIVARLLDLPGLPPVNLQLSGEGPITDFAATLDFAAGPAIGAAGTARVSRQEMSYDLDLDLQARLAGLMPGAIAPLFEGVTQLTGQASVVDGGSFALDGLSLTTPVAALTVTGTVSAEQRLDLRLTAAAVPNEAGVTQAGAASLEELWVDMAVQGPLLSPRFDGLIEASGVVTPQGRFETLDLTIESAPIGNDPEAERFTIALLGDLEGIALADEALGRAIGDSISVVARGTVDRDGVADITQARIMTPTMAGNFAGRVAPDLVDGTLSASITDLTAFSELAGLPLRGAAEIEANITGDPSVSELVARLEGELTGFASGQEAIDGLFGETVTLSGGVARVPDGFAVDDLRLRGGNLDVLLNGRAEEDVADFGLNLTIADLSAIDQRIEAGRLAADARLTGALRSPDFAGTVTITDMQALGQAVPRLALEVEAVDLFGMLVADITLDGIVAGNAATGAARIRAVDLGGYALEDLDLRVGSVSLAGDLTVDEALRAEGEVSLRAGELADIGPLLLARLNGELDARIALEVVDGGQNARIVGDGSSIRYEDIALTGFNADLTAVDIYRAPVINGVVEANALTVGGQTFSEIRLSAEGTADQTSFDVSAEAEGFDLEAGGRLIPADGDIRIVLDTFSATRGQQTIALSDPASIVVADGAVAIDDFVLRANGGTVSVSGRAGEELDLAVEITSLPLSIAEIASPGLGLSGTANGQARITGTAGNPSGSYSLTLSDVSLPQLRDAGLTSLDASATGTFADGRASVDATVSAANAQLRITGSAPLGATGELSLEATGTIELAAANVFLAPQGRRLSGVAQVALDIGGTPADPQINGTLEVQGANFTDELLGLDISGISARVRAVGDALQIESFSATTANGGTVSATGRVQIDPDAGFPGEIAVTGRRAQLVDSDLATAVADFDITVSGPLATSPLIAGRVVLITLDITVPDRLPTTLQPLPGTVHVAPPPQAQRRLAVAREREAAVERGPAFEARLDLVVIAANRIFVRGRGLNAELGGELRLTGTTLDPVAIGGFELRRGRLDLLGQRLDLTRGRIDFAGDLTPSLDFVAETQTSDVLARIIVAGPANNPEFRLESSPDLPQDEILSRILFDRAAGGLSAAQALQLAQGIATLAGGGPGVFEQLRRSLGVDSLEITAGAEGPAVGVSRYITDNVRLGIRAGARPEDTGVSVDIDLSRRLRLQGQVGADGGTSVGVGYEIEY